MTKKEMAALFEKYTPEELAEGYVFRVKLSKKQQQESDLALKEELARRRSEYSPEFKTQARLLQLRFQLEDYLKEMRYDPEKNFGYFLRQYLLCTDKRSSELAAEIDILPSELSQYLNNHRKPPKHIMIRLELHARNAIPASDWYRVAEMETLHELATDKAIRRKQKPHVHRVRA